MYLAHEDGSPMESLDPARLDGFLRRFHHGRDARLSGVEMAMTAGRVTAVTFTLSARDADRDDTLTRLRLQVGEVSELRVQVRPTEDPTVLADGLRVGQFQGLYFLDLLPWTDDPAGVHDYRASSCYAAGVYLRWEPVT
jgi:hypothetical protein